MDRDGTGRAVLRCTPKRQGGQMLTVKRELALSSQTALDFLQSMEKLRARSRERVSEFTGNPRFTVSSTEALERV